MKYEDKKLLITSISMIIFLGFFAYRNFTNIKNIEEISPFPQEMPNFEIPSLDEIFPTNIDDLMYKYGTIEEAIEPEAIEYVFHSIPGIAILEYPSHWKELDLRMVPLREDMLNIIFVAHSKNIKQPTMLVVLEIKADNLEKSMSVMENIFRQEGATMSFVKKTQIENGLYFEIDYEYEDGQKMKSKEKLVKINDRFYLFSVVTQIEKFRDYSLQMEHIINSVQIIK